MGKYSKTISEFGIKKAIANELAEMNRLKRMKLRVELKSKSYRRFMIKTYKGQDGKEFTVPPTEDDRKKCQEDWDAVEDELEDCCKVEE